ncbi:ABC-type uncharacterized transport system, substrate-binding protein [Desulfonauticus submarinus]|uniref:ABC-type uncharacterized transport system, substrate-binding protein n=1 Tax=Desulfonauticus submarinus TaxID=206665 RepID=A0A1G9ZW87_9BACT|nr:ABC transporter substrate binding protein [Desulfonauticus submarinus]SDN25458.1 ABC-type uncharacterized transport system, substrate-binding protein [Desulfonauticus submarinus]
MKKIIFFLIIFPIIINNNCLAKIKKIRIGYLEAGQFWAYDGIYNAFKQSLKEKGWGNKIEFPPNAHFSPGWEPEHVPEYEQRARELMERKDIDFVIAMGTAATQALLKVNNGKKPILAMGVADPLASGFIKSYHDSGIDNFTIRVVPNRWKIMFEIFYDVVHFKKLGIMYSDTKTGRVYANLKDAREVAKEKGFKLIEYNKLSTAEELCECDKGLDYLISKGIDAFFISSLVCFDWTKSDVQKLMNKLIKNKIPTFARDGSSYVQAGALMGFSSMDFSAMGDFLANMAIQIFKGKKPRDVNMIDRPSPKIAVNLETALKIGFDFPVTILIASDEIYDKIILPSNRKFK